MCCGTAWAENITSSSNLITWFWCPLFMIIITITLPITVPELFWNERQRKAIVVKMVRCVLSTRRPRMHSLSIATPPSVLSSRNVSGSRFLICQNDGGWKVASISFALIYLTSLKQTPKLTSGVKTSGSACASLILKSVVYLKQAGPNDLGDSTFLSRSTTELRQPK